MAGDTELPLVAGPVLEVFAGPPAPFVAPVTADPPDPEAPELVGPEPVDDAEPDDDVVAPEEATVGEPASDEADDWAAGA